MRFDSYHPAILFFYFVTVLACTALFRHPVFLAVSYAAAFLYSVKLSGKRAAVFNLLLALLAVCGACFYASYHHFGVTVLWRNFIDNAITLEAFVYGLVISFQAASFLMWFSCIHAVFCSDKAVYLFGRLCPRFAMVFAVLLQFIPRIRQFAKQANMAQSGIGRGFGQGNIRKRSLNFFRIASIVVTWTIESLIGILDSMKSRGAILKGRSAFSIYRFDYRDRCFTIGMSVCIAAILMGALLDQAYTLYDPEIILNKATPFSIVFYMFYAFFCLLPMLAEAACIRSADRQRFF